MKNTEQQNNSGASIGHGVDIKSGDFTGRDSVHNTITVPQNQGSSQQLYIIALVAIVALVTLAIVFRPSLEKPASVPVLDMPTVHSTKVLEARTTTSVPIHTATRTPTSRPTPTVDNEVSTATPNASSTFSCATVTEIPQAECDALVSLYENNDGPNWGNSTRWLATDLPCQWYGVICEDGHIVQLDLAGESGISFGLRGDLSAEIGNLTELKILNLASNSLQTIPPTIENLTSLVELNMNMNELTTLPAEIKNVATLEQLSLIGNQLSSLPPGMSKLSNLKTLALSGNDLNTLPVEIWYLANLKTLYLDGNGIDRLPPEIGNLSQLEVLALSENQLQELPDGLWSLANLTRLRLNNNPLQTLPAGIGKLSALTELNLSGNQLTILPAEIWHLSNLKQLSLAENQLTTLSSEVSRLSKLWSLVLRDNQLTELPEETWSLSKMAYLDLSHNRLDTLSAQIKNFSGLNWLRLEGNQLRSLPEEIGHLYGLDTLNLSNNRLDRLPMNLVKLLDLSDFNVSANYLVITDTTLRDWMNERDPDWADTQVLDLSDAEIKEMNDTCEQARSISTNGAPQEYIFSTVDDVDWVRFDVTAGTEYVIRVDKPSNSTANVFPNLFHKCDNTTFFRSPKSDKTHSLGGRGHKIEISSGGYDGTVYLSISNYGQTYGKDASYRVSAQALTSESQNQALIVVAGRYRESDPDNIHNVTNNVYRTFQQNGYNEKNIYYLATDPMLNGYDAPADLDNIQYAITEWAVDRLDEGGVLTLYIIGHGNGNKLYIDRLNEQILPPNELDRWFDRLEEATLDIDINIILETSQAGLLIRGDASISKSGRVIITSSSDTSKAYASRNGAIFSDVFMNSLRQGHDFFHSFFEAQGTAKAYTAYQEPWLDANGNGEPNEQEDWDIASKRNIAHAENFDLQNSPPFITQMTGTSMIGKGIGALQAEVRDDRGIDRVWAVVYPPSYTPPENSIGEWIDEELQVLDLQEAGDDLYSAEILFSEIGNYRIVVYAEDNRGLLARPETFTFLVNAVDSPIPTPEPPPAWSGGDF